MREKNITWENLKSDASHHENYKIVSYRGHASLEWGFESSLQRYLRDKKNEEKDAISSNQYYEIVKEIARTGKIKDIDSLALPLINPLRISIMTANEQHESEFQILFSAMLKLRHLGFPSPILDMTHSFFVAAGFALIENSTNECVIFRLSEKNLDIQKSDLFNPEPYLIHNTAIKDQPERHQRQESAYLVSVYNKKGPYYQGNPETTFHLPSEKLLTENPHGRFELEKFNITDVENVRDELKKLGIDRKYLYGNLRIEEENHLRDIVEKIVF